MIANRARGGFTLIEVMVVVIIIAALAGMVLPRLLASADEAKRSVAQGAIANLSTGLKLYWLHNGRFPSTDEGLKALLTKPASAANWRGPYLEDKPLDPWNREFKYVCPGTHHADGFDLWSLGSDEAGADDDVTNWKQ